MYIKGHKLLGNLFFTNCFESYRLWKLLYNSLYFFHVRRPDTISRYEVQWSNIEHEKLELALVLYIFIREQQNNAQAKDENIWRLKLGFSSHYLRFFFSINRSSQPFFVWTDISFCFQRFYKKKVCFKKGS